MLFSVFNNEETGFWQNMFGRNSLEKSGQLMLFSFIISFFVQSIASVKKIDKSYKTYYLQILKVMYYWIFSVCAFKKQMIEFHFSVRMFGSKHVTKNG